MDILKIVIEYIANGGGAAIIALLLAMVVILIWDRQALVKNISETTQRVYDAKDSETKSIREIVDRYHKGNLDLVQALNEIKIVLTTIQNAKR